MGRIVGRCPTCHRLQKRSSEANRRYWALLHLIAERVKPEGEQHAAQTWHVYFKQRFLGVDEVKLPNGKTVLTPKSSAELDTSEFNDYVMQVEQWAHSRDIYLED